MMAMRQLEIGTRRLRLSPQHRAIRDAAQGAPKFGDWRTHQMNSADAREVLRQTALDAAEDADMLIVRIYHAQEAALWITRT